MSVSGRNIIVSQKARLGGKGCGATVCRGVEDAEDMDVSRPDGRVPRGIGEEVLREIAQLLLQ